jgi:hypothetical protein
VLLACLLHVLLPRHRRFLGAGLHLNQLSRFRGPPQAIARQMSQAPITSRFPKTYDAGWYHMAVSPGVGWSSGSMTVIHNDKVLHHVSRVTDARF